MWNRRPGCPSIVGAGMHKFLEILVFLPVVGAIIGYVSKWTAIQMLFVPERFIGVGPIGWQGVVQRRAPKFSAGVADTVERTGVRVGELVERIAPNEVAEALGPIVDRMAPSLLARIVDELKPGFWATLPEPARAMLTTQVAQETRRIATVVIAALKPALVASIDLRALVIQQLSGPNANRLARLFRRVGRRELQVVIYYGAVLGFFIGLVEVAGYAALEKWWLLPLIGALDGLVNNWFAIQMIFRPLERTKYFGVFPYQGLFPARQDEIAREYAHMLETEVLSPRDLLQHAWEQGGPRLVKTAMGTVEREIDALLPMLEMVLQMPIEKAARAQATAALAAEIERALPSVLPEFEAYLADRLGIAATIDRALQVMPKDEFEAVLRGVFEEDEWILVTLGGVLGGAIGLLQAAVVGFFI